MSPFKGWLHRNYDIIRMLVREGTSVLDLGCADGTFLKNLKQEKNIRPLGIEINEEKVVQCIKNGIPVLAGNLDLGLPEFKDHSFDYVILNQTLQEVRKPDFVLDEMLRVGKKAIIGFPNFGHIATRFYLMMRGRMPVTRQIPFQWYNSPNIHFCTVRDFRIFCKDRGYKILDTFYYGAMEANFLISAFPNLLATEAVFLIEK
jgi:methionine biosynthesis protein MetW